MIYESRKCWKNLLRCRAKIGTKVPKSSVKCIFIERFIFCLVENFAWSKELQTLLHSTFRIENFRVLQLQVINAILSKHDVLMLAPTGGGKSLCYQLPALISKGITIVVMPLLSLIENQIWSLQRFGIEAEKLCQTSERTKNNAILKKMSDSSDVCSLKLLFVTPEYMAKSKHFRTALQKSYFSKKLNLIAIDEVHCASQYGHDFRPDYNFMGSLKTLYPEVPILGVTATASCEVIVDLQKTLHIRDCLVLKAPFNRPNLYYHVSAACSLFSLNSKKYEECPQVMEKPTEKVKVYELLVKLLKDRYLGQTGIIYTFSKKDAEDLAVELMKRDIQAGSYHDQLSAERRTRTQSKWLDGSLQVIVATAAFGMGINKPDVRFVIHHTISKSMENFYQESGRAGHDGQRLVLNVKNSSNRILFPLQFFIELIVF